MAERVILLVGVMLVLVVAFSVFKRRQLKTARSAVVAANTASTLNAKPQIVYFWSTQCRQCITVQTPIIDKLAAVAGEYMLTVNKFNICESLEQANKWGVKTVPTTFVLDKGGTVQHVNNGLVTEKVLVEQIKALQVSCN